MCVYSQIKDIKHIRQDFHSVAWVVVGFGGGVGVKTSFRNLTKFGLLVIHMNGHATCLYFLLCPLGVKRSNIIKFQLQSQFQRFLNQKDIKHIKQDFHAVPWVMPQGWDLGVLGGGGKNLIF